jgi:hypothetical protein
MSPLQQDRWKDQLLAEILRAISSHPPLRRELVFKGARILALHLGSPRQSLDVDANLRLEFQRSMPDRGQQAAWFEAQLTTALRNHFESQEPVRYELGSVKIEKRPADERHPRGWDGFRAKIQVTDQKFRGIRSLPTLELDLAAPEELGPDAVCELPLDGVSVQAYALHRIAGEKLRAFLSSLPAYRSKMRSPLREVRAKDLHDLALILDARPVEDRDFWLRAAHEFRLACASRLVDCQGPESFHEAWDSTRKVYETEATLAAVPWSAAEQALGAILGFFSRSSVFPLSFPLEDSDVAPPDTAASAT